MLRITLSLILLFAVTAATVADAAWYKKTDNTIVDPIQYTSGGAFPGGDHPYSGNNLNTGGNLTGADLIEADPSVKVHNPGHVIATLTDAVDFELEMVITRGRGYEPATERHQRSSEER